jgi:hypothetical protein
MRRKRVMRGLAVVGLGAMLTVGMGVGGVASAAPQGRSERSTSTTVASSRGRVPAPWR